MGQAGGHQTTVEKLYAIYTEQGFLREEEALSVMSAVGVSLVGINRVTDRLMELGVIFSDDAISDDDEDNDRAQTDYEAIYAEILEIAPGQRVLVDYIHDVRPPQNREWRPLITQMNSGNEYAFGRLFDMYLRVVVKIALRFHKYEGFELDDAIQEGSMGLIRAIRQYDSSRHGNLGSYLPLWIQQYISRAVADKGRTIRLPVHTYEIVQRLKTSRKKLYDMAGIEPSYAKIAEDAGTSMETAMKLIEATQEPVSLENILENDDNEEIIFKYFSIPSFEEEMVDASLAEKLRELLSTLTSKEARVLSLRFGLDDGRERTLEAVGGIFRVTRERVRQIEDKALRKLRHPSRVKHITDFI
jgi:RNA polymerase primary sigma factor